MTYTLEEAQALHEKGYTPVTAAEIQAGDLLAYNFGGMPTVYVTTQRVNPRTFVVNGVMGREVMVWCQHESGAVLVERFDDSSVVYIAPNVGFLETGEPDA